MDLLKMLLGKLGLGKQELISPIPKSVMESYFPTQQQGQASPTPTATPRPTQMPTPRPTATPMPQVAGVMDEYITGRNPSAKTNDPVVVKAITQAANRFGVPKEFLADLFFAESSFNPGSKNTTPEGVAAGVPIGLAQFRPGTWDEVRRYTQNPESIAYGMIPEGDMRSDPNLNALAAAYLIKQGQLGKWDASQWNWGQYWPEEELSKYGFYDQTLSRKR